MNQKSLNWGIGITVVWLAVIVAFWIFGGLKSPTSLNELGDFLAGIFAPVAFFWLILGYVQQGKQLEQNTKALEQQERALQLQIDEMKESVKQQKEIAVINEKSLQASFEKERPEITYIFPSCYKHSKDSYSLLFRIHNIGKGDCYNLQAALIEGQSSREFISFLKVRNLATISLSAFKNNFVEHYDKDLYGVNNLIDFSESKYTGEIIFVKIKMEYENIYGQKFKEIFEIKFPLKPDFDKMLKQYNFDRE